MSAFVLCRFQCYFVSMARFVYNWNTCPCDTQQYSWRYVTIVLQMFPIACLAISGAMLRNYHSQQWCRWYSPRQSDILWWAFTWIKILSTRLPCVSRYASVWACFIVYEMQLSTDMSRRRCKVYPMRRCRQIVKLSVSTSQNLLTCSRNKLWGSTS